MPTTYHYVCHNPRCPGLLRLERQEAWNGTPEVDDDLWGSAHSSDEHQHCGYCNSKTDGQLEAVAIGRVERHEIAYKSGPERKPIRL